MWRSSWTGARVGQFQFPSLDQDLHILFVPCKDAPDSQTDWFHVNSIPVTLDFRMHHPVGAGPVLQRCFVNTIELSHGFLTMTPMTLLAPSLVHAKARVCHPPTPRHRAYCLFDGVPIREPPGGKTTSNASTGLHRSPIETSQLAWKRVSLLNTHPNDLSWDLAMVWRLQIWRATQEKSNYVRIHFSDGASSGSHRSPYNHPKTPHPVSWRIKVEFFGGSQKKQSGPFQTLSI